jgi:hypothetical protein
MERVRYKYNGALDQVGMELGSKFNPKKISILGLLGWEDSGPEVICRDEPATLECVENVKHQEFSMFWKWLFLGQFRSDGDLTRVKGWWGLPDWGDSSGGWCRHVGRGLIENPCGGKLLRVRG